MAKLLKLVASNGTNAIVNPDQIVSISGATNGVVHTSSTAITVTGASAAVITEAVREAVADLNRDAQAIVVDVTVGTAIATAEIGA